MGANCPTMRASWLGRIQYRPTLQLQRSLLQERKAEEIPDTLLLLEHDHVFTLGRRADATHLLTSEGAILADDAEVIETDRGGQATYHGPGQLVAYPIIGVRDLGLGPVAYVRLLEETAIQVLSEFGIRGHRMVGKTGVWIDGEPGSKVAAEEPPKGRKIAAIGVRISGGVAMHGLALNVSTDLRYYSHIVPCGMPGMDMTSIFKESGFRIETDAVARLWAEAFADILFFDIDWMPASSLSDVQSAPMPVSV
jgi:lipoate-protein ligase B